MSYVRAAGSTYPAHLPIPPALVARAQECLRPWSTASSEERHRALEIIREANRRRVDERFTHMVAKAVEPR